MGLTKMADMQLLTFLALVATLLGALVLKKLRGGQFIKSTLKSNMNENTKHSPSFSVSWKETESTLQDYIVLLVGSMRVAAVP